MYDINDNTVGNILASMGMSNLSLTIFLVVVALLLVAAGLTTMFVVTRESRRVRRATLAALESNAMISNAITGSND